MKHVNMYHLYCCFYLRKMSQSSLKENGFCASSCGASPWGSDFCCEKWRRRIRRRKSGVYVSLCGSHGPHDLKTHTHTTGRFMDQDGGII